MVKKLPGAESMLMVYDLRDRLAATQDGVQRAKSPKEWLYTKYDELNRPILTGTIQSANTRVQMQTALNAYTGTNLYETRTTSSTHHYYTQNSFPNSDFTKTYLAVSYYDDYDINNDGSGSGDPAYTTDTDFPNNAAFSRLKNKVTVSKARELDPASSSEVWFTTASFFDKQYRVIQTKTTGIQGGSNLVTNEVNFPGWLLKSKETQTVVQGSTSLTNTVLTRNDYDHQGRLLNTYHKINSGTEKTLSSLSYNELGQLLTRKLHVTSGTGLQKLDYTYNIRGWLKKINEPDLSGSDGDFFGMELLYNEDFTALNGTNQWNGNISGMKFKNSSSGVQKGYGYTYDQLNRLTAAKYGQGSSFTTNVDRYNENMTYDRNGNILTLSRKGQTASGVFGNLDILTYSYTGMGNQVRAVGDAVTDVQGRGDFYDSTDGNSNKEYYYDRNGNMWLDRNKKMKVVYNILNLPAQVIDTVTTSDKIEYVYTSSGVKLKQRLSAGTTLLYNGSFVYELDGTANGIIVKYILTAEGRANYLSGAYTYEYFMKDHLGNTRTAFDVPSGAAVITQQDDYYPFGMLHQPQDATTSTNRYLYNGKELQDESLGGVNLDWYDYGSRYYDPQIGRWMVVDPMAEKFYDYSSYSYGQNNPVGNIDVGGHFVFKDASKYPELSRLLQNIHKVLDNPSIMSGLQKFSGLDPQVIRQQFTPGIGPEIRTANLLDRYPYDQRVGNTIDDGTKEFVKGDGTIEIEYRTVKHLKDAILNGNSEEYNEYLFYIVLIILHEYTHSGDIQKHGTRFSDLDQPNDNCLGYQFEKETFGRKMFGLEDVRKYIREHINYVEQDNENNKKKNKEFWNTIMNLAPGTYHFVNGIPVKDK